jgi:hypothetical protein
MNNDNLHPVFQELLMPWTPPEDDGQEQAQAEPEPRDPISHLLIGGYKREAELLSEAKMVLLYLTGIAACPDAYPDKMIRTAIAEGETLIDKISGIKTSCQSKITQG